MSNIKNEIQRTERQKGIKLSRQNTLALILALPSIALGSVINAQAVEEPGETGGGTGSETRSSIEDRTVAAGLNNGTRIRHITNENNEFGDEDFSVPRGTTPIDTDLRIGGFIDGSEVFPNGMHAFPLGDLNGGDVPWVMFVDEEGNPTHAAILSGVHGEGGIPITIAELMDAGIVQFKYDGSGIVPYHSTSNSDTTESSNQNTSSTETAATQEANREVEPLPISTAEALEINVVEGDYSITTANGERLNFVITPESAALLNRYGGIIDVNQLTEEQQAIVDDYLYGDVQPEHVLIMGSVLVELQPDGDSTTRGRGYYVIPKRDGGFTLIKTGQSLFTGNSTLSENNQFYFIALENPGTWLEPESGTANIATNSFSNGLNAVSGQTDPLDATPVVTDLITGQIDHTTNFRGEKADLRLYLFTILTPETLLGEIILSIPDDIKPFKGHTVS